MKHLHPILFPLMSELGYKKANETNWTLRMREIMILSTIIRYDNAPCFDINLGIVFNPSINPVSWKKFRHRSAQFNITLHDLLSTLGYQPDLLDMIFFYDRLDIPETEKELKNNLPIILDLLKNEVLPYFENWNDYNWLLKNFKKEIRGKQFEVHGEHPDSYIDLFKRHVHGPLLSNVQTI